MIDIQGLSKSYGKLQALQEVKLQWNSSEVVALIGPNGSGKTTLIKCILGLVFPSHGNILYKGESIIRKHQYRNDFGYMSQITRFPEQLKVGEFIDIMIDVRNCETSKMDFELYEAYKIESIRDKSLRSLSGGTRQKVNASLAFLFNPRVLIMDEPTAGLDPLAVEILKSKINRLNKSDKLLIITSHILSDLEEFTTRINYLQDGKVRFDLSFDELKMKTGQDKLSKALAEILNRD